MLEKMAVILIASFKYPMCQLEVRNVGLISRLSRIMVKPETHQPRSALRENHICKLELGIAADRLTDYPTADLPGLLPGRYWRPYLRQSTDPAPASPSALQKSPHPHQNVLQKRR